MRSNKGITLIVLVVTIIVLLILAGISIQMVSGNNGILTRTKEAKELTEDSQDIELLNLKILESSLNNGMPNIGSLVPKLQEIGCTVSGGSYPLSVEYNGNNYQIDSEGTLEKTEGTDILTKEENYLIVMPASKSKFEGKTNVGTIEEFRTLVNSGTFDYTTAYLYENIELNGSATNVWTPIGTSTNKFDKTFDGRNYNISGLYLSNSSQGQGLFGFSAGTIQNVTVNGQINCTAVGAAGITGQNEGTIENCISNVSIIGKEYVGGIAGYSTETSTIRNCKSTGTIQGEQIVGGIAGGCDGNIIGCSNYGTVKSTSATSSVAAPVSGLCGTGGIVGVVYLGTVSNSKNLAYVEGYSNCVGGIAGTNHTATIESCYNDGEISADKGRYRRYSWTSKR